MYISHTLRDTAHILNRWQTLKIKIMRWTYLVLVILLISCNSESPITENDQKEFTEMTQIWQSKYVEGSVNLKEILSGMDENIIMWENDKI